MLQVLLSLRVPGEGQCNCWCVVSVTLACNLYGAGCAAYPGLCMIHAPGAVDNEAPNIIKARYPTVFASVALI